MGADRTLSPPAVDRDDQPSARRARAIYFSALCCAVILFFLTRQIAPGLDAVGWSLGLIRFLLGACALGAAVLTWATAVHMAYVYRVAWPLGLATAVVVATVAFSVIRWFSAPGARAVLLP